MRLVECKLSSGGVFVVSQFIKFIDIYINGVEVFY